MAESLPSVDEQFVASCRHEYETARDDVAKEQDEARLRYVWALVHSSARQHIELGRDLASAERSNPDARHARDYRYLLAVALYKMREYVQARQDITALLEDHPDFRQAVFLKGLVEDALVHEGLVGVGIAGAVAGAALLGLGLLLGGRKR